MIVQQNGAVIDKNPAPGDTAPLSEGEDLLGPQSIQNAAVLLNANAKRVTRGVVRKVEDMVPRAQTYISHSIDDARSAVREIVDKGYETVFCGGGDGTFISTINQIKAAVDERNQRFQDAMHRIPFPKLGVLKLGTGNSLSALIGNMRGVEPLRLLRDGLPPRTRRIDLIEAEERCFHFGGLGWDAAILNDYNWLKERFGRVPVLRHFAHGFPGYIAAMVTRTIPKEIAATRPRVRAVNEGDRVFIRRHGRPAEPLAVRAGDTIYEGEVSVLGASTVPYYGYNMRAYPFAGEIPGFMSFRIFQTGLREVLSHMPGIYRGRYQSDRVHDFLATRVRLEFDRPIPLQIGGDGMGYREGITFSMSDLSVDLLDFSPA
ncbi:MAG: diacylglycerol kinase family protein [Deltaproteobacteria bacterium]|nr:diacylglycerol kinase family protein [Deltaproteobacteria bacterium]